MSGELLTSAEAAVRLGIKRETLYAYVSRGLLQRKVSADGRASLFDPTEIDALRGARKRPATGEVATIISSALTEIVDSGPRYRGHDVATLLQGDHTFEDVADLLWQSDGPWVPDPVPPALVQAQAGMNPATPLLDRLRVSVAFLSGSDPFRADRSAPWMALAGRRIIGAMVDGLPAAGRSTGARTGKHIADRLWSRLTTERGTAAQRAALDASLILLADHGLASSTFAVRVSASVRADPYSLVQTGLGAMGGTLHGSVSSEVHQLLVSASQQGADNALAELLGRHREVPGFGNSVYDTADPRELLLTERLESAFATKAKWKIIRQVREITAVRVDKPANIDFALGAFTWLAGMDPMASEVIFSVARTAGWLAHAMEEFTEEPERFRLQTRIISQRLSAED